MLTAESLHNVDDTARREMLDDLANRLYGTDRYIVQLAADLGIKRGTIDQWKSKVSPPNYALLYLSLRLQLQVATAHLVNLRDAIDFAGQITSGD
ncbi:MAG: hypothetical protein JXQ91_07620 [Vannielia sp.]|uniref:hypothetical protein n=1 Tax=Vannielia sp. TaxID=2813045 RepID=UPI003B8C7EB9